MGMPPAHTHCPARNTEGAQLDSDTTGCAIAGGACTLPQGHLGMHFCSHGHSF